MTPSATIHREVDILERAIDPRGGAWPPDVARAILPIKLAPEDVSRMNQLAGKAAAGTLDSDEELEIESYRSATRLLEILKLRSRISLKQAGQSGEANIMRSDGQGT
jgi:hypothetical protein